MPDSRPISGLPDTVRGTSLTVGTFDGMHLGHQDVLRRLVRRASEAGHASLLVTFSPHPLELLRPELAPPLLTVPAEKLEILAQLGLDYVAVVPFTPRLAALDASAFVRDILLARYRMRELLIGYDHRFGRGRSGDAAMLRALGESEGFDVDVVGAVSAGGERPVSSTVLRRAVADGDLDAVARGLGRPYSLSGVVVRGEARGRLLGFPTLNVEPAPGRKLLPPAGVYAVRAHTASGHFGGMMNLGGRPTFGDDRSSVEVHLFDAAGDFYGHHVRLDFVARLRETRRFADAAALADQLRIDETAARRALTRA